jgi:hypothetical protein
LYFYVVSGVIISQIPIYVNSQKGLAKRRTDLGISSLYLCHSLKNSHLVRTWFTMSEVRSAESNGGPGQAVYVPSELRRALDRNTNRGVVRLRRTKTDGGPGQVRTDDTSLFKRVLYQLSYRATNNEYIMMKGSETELFISA